MFFLRHFTSLLVFRAVVFTGCSLVDEDFGDCGEDFKLNYELQLVTNMRTEIQTVFDLQADLQLATSLQEHFEEVFTDHAHDVDLSFYDTTMPLERLEHMEVEMDASHSSYILNLPGRDYMHLCAANLAAEPFVSLRDDQRCASARLVQIPEVKDTLSPHTTGIFTARKHLLLDKTKDQFIEVNLYMVNAATALVLDVEDAPSVKDIKVFLNGFADGFSIADSTYSFNSDYIVRTVMLPAVPGSAELCFTSCHFPSKDVDSSIKGVIDTDEPFISEESEEALWQWRVYATLEDNTITESILYVHAPLRAGQLKVVKGRIHADGAASTDDRLVGVSVCLDWQPGMEHDIPL